MVKKLSEIAQKDVSIAQKAKALTRKKKISGCRARPHERDATSVISATGSMRKTDKGTLARMRKEMPMPVRMDGTNFCGAWVKPRASSGTIY